jgi:hypothetical protein
LVGNIDIDQPEEGGCDAVEDAAFREDMTIFFIEQLEKELAGDSWVLEDEADDLYGVSDCIIRQDQ